MVHNHKLREARLLRAWTYKDVADQIALPDSHTVGRWERGTTFPSSHYRQELCRIFEKSIEELGLLRPSISRDTSLVDKSNAGEAFNKVPIAFSSFVGRKQEVIEASTLLKSPTVRLLTLVGTGGIGKTRLAIEVALQMRDHFDDGICFVPLSNLRDSASILPALVAALGIQDSVPLSLEHLVKTFLHEKQVLLLMDNFEHIASAAPFIEGLLLDCHHVKVLVTSRHVLQLEAEHTFVVPPLSLPNFGHPLAIEGLMHYAGIALFIQRVQTHLPTFKITESNADAIAELCMHLDGLPLVIELAAARIKLFSPQALLTRLLQDQHVLKSDLRTIPERHRTLYLMIKSSYDLLDEQEQWLLRHLAIFVGNIALETIEAVLSVSIKAPSTIMEIVTSLLNKSLLQRIERDNEEPRFFMLETIRYFAVSCLQSNSELEELQHTYAHYYLTLVEQAAPYLKNPQQAMWLTTLEQEMGNLRAALQWFIERQESELALRFCEPFGKFCGLRGYWHEEQRWLRGALQLPQTQQQGIRGRVLRRAGHLAYRLRDLADARTLLEQSVVCSREAEDWQNLAGALSGLGWVLYRQNEIHMAGQLLKECVEIAHRANDLWVLANCLESLGRFIHYQGNTNEAYILLQESVAISRKYSDKENLARILMTMITLEVAQGNMVQAAKLAQESFVLAQELGTKPLLALALDSSGEVALFQGAYTQARQYFEERIEMAEDLGDTSAIASRKLKLADMALMEGDIKQAQHLVDEALALLRQQDDPSDIAIAHSILGDLKRMEGDMIQARSLYFGVLRHYSTSGDKRKIGRCLVGLAQMFLDQEVIERAAYLLGAAESRLRVYDMYPAQHTNFQQTKEHMRILLGEADFAQIWKQGNAASYEQILSML